MAKSKGYKWRYSNVHPSTYEDMRSQEKEASWLEYYKKFPHPSGNFWGQILSMFFAVVYEPLRETSIKDPKPFNPTVLDSRQPLIENRIQILPRIGEIWAYFILTGVMPHQEAIWYFSLKEAKQYASLNPVRGLTPTGKPKTDGILNNQTFYISVIPTTYDSKKTYPRLCSTGCSTLQTLDKVCALPAMYQKLEQVFGFHLWNLDMSAAHLRIFAHFFDRHEIPNVYKCLESPDYWSIVAKELEIEGLFPELDTKTLRKVAKRGSLAILNGGSSSSPAHLLEDLNDYLKWIDRERDVKEYSRRVMTRVGTLPIAREIQVRTKQMYAPGKVWPIHSYERLIPDLQNGKAGAEGLRKGAHSLLSKLWSGAEVALMSSIIEYLGYTKTLHGVEFVVLVLVHDGLTLASNKPVPPESVRNIEDGCANFMQECWGLNMPVELSRCNLHTPD